MNKNLTAFCGICCGDCIPSKEEFFSTIDRLDEMLGELQFEEYAQYKTSRHPAFREYPAFFSVLRQIKQLRCPTCRQGGGNPQCEVRRCVQNKRLNGCWECNERSGCVFLDRLRGVHPNLDYNLDLIAKMGSEKWFEKRKEHYQWK
jgi:Protein of unknown function (DUF3795)